MTAGTVGEEGWVRTMADVARAVGKKPGTVSRWRSTEGLPESAYDSSRGWHLPTIVDWLMLRAAQNATSSHAPTRAIATRGSGPGPEAGENGEPTDTREWKEFWLGRKARAAALKLEGSLIEREQVEAELVSRASVLANGFNSLGHRCASPLGQITDTHERKEFIDGKVREILEVYSRPMPEFAVDPLEEDDDDDEPEPAKKKRAKKKSTRKKVKRVGRRS